MRDAGWLLISYFLRFAGLLPAEAALSESEGTASRCC